jgi:hypothetical protein
VSNKILKGLYDEEIDLLWSRYFDPEQNRTGCLRSLLSRLFYHDFRLF